MDTSTKRRSAEKVRRGLTANLNGLGFVRTKTGFWSRSREHVIEFIHLHLYSFRPAFRVHLGIRVLNDTFDAPALNGPSSDGQSGRGFAFNASDESIMACIQEISHFCSSEAVSWFQRYEDYSSLLDPSSSPLSSDACSKLDSALKGNVDEVAARKSMEMLGAT